MDLELAICYTLIRIGIPILLLFAVCIRQNLLSGIYLIFLLVGPYLPYSSGRSLTKGHVGIYLKILIVVSSIICVGQVVFQIVLLVSPAEYRSTLDYCSSHGFLLNSIGLNRLDDVSIFEILRLIGLDFVVFFFSASVFLVTENIYEKWADRLAARRAGHHRESNSQLRQNANENEHRIVGGGDGDSNDEISPVQGSSTTTGPSTSQTTSTICESRILNDRDSTIDGTTDVKDIQRIERYRLRRQKALETIKLISEVIFVILLCGAGILNPSLSSSIYFISFLSIVTLVSCNKKLGNLFVKFKLFLCFVLICHLTALFLYQMDWFRIHLPETSLGIRLFGLRPYIKVNCTTARELHFENLNWNIYAHPFFLVILYVLAGSFVRAEIFHRTKINIDKLNDLVEEESEVVGYTMPLHDLAPFKTESTPLLSGTEPKRYQALHEQPSAPITGLEMDPHGSLTWRNDVTDGVSVTSSNQKANQATNPTSPNPTTVDRSQRWAPILYLMNLIKRGSYALTLIVMMTWSITYHSWLGFTLLLWSCVIWMMPNSRQACLKSSFCLVIYAILLLLSQYIFSLDLREDELPQFIGTINLNEIGLKKYFDMSYKPLALKTIFTCMFWITLRQYSEERALSRWNQDRDRSLSTNRGSQGRPSFQRHMSLASAVLPQVSPTLLILSNFIRGLFIKYWIWVVATMLMIMSLGGDRVVIYRIVYMSLFLSFIFIFQLSFRLWRKFMYPFWLVVIIYSMTVLIAIYTYQFQHFARYWQDYFRISKEMQEALGLKLYGADPWVLFKELFTPTFFLIITIIQLRFWHKDFLLFTRCDLFTERREESYTTSSSAPTAGPSTSISASTTTRDIKIDMDSSDITVTTTTKYTPSQAGTSQTTSSTKKSGKTTSRTTTTIRGSADGIESLLKPESKKKRIPRLSVSFLSSKLRSFKENIAPGMKFCHQLMWRLLEIHLMKVVLLVSIIAALNEVSLANVAFVIFISIAIPLTHFEKFVSYLIGSWASVLILTKMVYQLPTVNSSTAWISNCSLDTSDNSTFPVPNPIDNRLYLGFKEVENDQVFNYIKLDLFVTLMLTVNSIVCIRQQIHRQRKNIKPLPLGIALVGVKRQDAENGFFGLSRYLINYCFYKFGLELTCFVIVIAIQGRQDIVSCFYAISLITFTMCPRRVINRLWPYFLGFLCIFVPIEYISCVGLPPGFCFNYPWKMSPYFSICREWLFLPDFIKPPNAQKLFYDFFVLLLSGRQYLVFKIERRPDSSNYDGGDNIDLGSEECSHVPDFEDFFTFTHTIYDHMRSLFYTTFVWITLAVVFLTAMTPDNLFGVGYIIGCFIFLWMGSDIYLRQQRNIVLAWKILVFYNLFVILSKTILQIVGCSFQKELLTNYCWAVKLMGIVCNAGILEPTARYSCIIDSMDKVQLTMDCLCFCFLIVQKRIFSSHYFKFLVKEIWAQTTLASRGAQLIHEVQLKEVREQENAEREVMEKIKAKMDRIRANQQASLGAKQDKIKYHYQAIKSGDYYMFDEPDLEVIDFNEKTRRPQIPDPVGDELDRISSLHGVTAFFSTLIKGQSTQSEIEQRRKAEDITDVGESSKDSAIISADREPETDHESSATTQYSSLPPTTIPESPESEGSSTLSIASESKKLPIDDEKSEETESEAASDDGQCESIIRKIEWWCKLISLFFKSCVISMTAKLNSVSRDYRFVSRRLAIERKALKRLIIDDDYDRDPDLKRETLELISKASYTDLNRISNSPRPVLIREEFFLTIVPREDHEAPSEDKLTTPDPFLEANFFVRFLWSLFYAVISHSEFLCYLLVILNQLINASLLSMPLPLMVFLWGCLSVPRPTRTFWLYVITYTELVIITKYMFSFKVWSWMSGPADDDPFWPPRMFGVADIDPVTHQIREGSKSKMDLLLLLALFFHRFMLKSLGLWDLDENYEFGKDSTKNREVASASGASRDELSKEPKIARTKGRKGSETYLRRRNIEDLSHTDGNIRYQDSDPLTPSDDKEIEMVQKLIEASENMHKKCWASVSPIRQFMRRILSPPFRIAKDYYAMMFFCDFINFFTVWFGYSSFGTSPGVGDITTYLQENRVPMPFLFMLLFQFGLIIIDRGLYLRKDTKKRLIFHIVISIAMHIFLFLALPAITRRSFISPDNNAPKLWYICKSIYLLLSAWQVKSGYPTRILGNCFTKKYTFVNSSLFMLYMMVPFLYDMRLMMDWMWTDTSLGLNEWAIMEDINKQLFERKCELTFEENFPEPGAISRRRVPKYIRGGAYLLLMIGAIWFPLFIFALSGTIGQPNKPSDFAIEIEFSGYQPIFKMSSTNDALEPFDSLTYNALELECTKHGWVGGQNLLSTYGYADAVKAKINGNSTAVWGISPPSQRQLIAKLQSNDTLLVKITYTVTRTAEKAKTQNLDPSIYDSHSIEITKDEIDLRNALIEMLRQPEDPDDMNYYSKKYEPAILRQIFPNYIKAPESGSPEVLVDFGQTYRDVEIVLRKGRFENGSITQWWEISEVNCSDDSPFAYFNDAGEHCRYLTSVIFSDKIFPGPLLQLISGHGIFGLYTTFVFVVSRIIRSFFADLCTKVIYTQMPCVDRVLQLCLDIYLVRESREFGLEEDLYAKLIFLYRSPETLIKWTKPIEPPSILPPQTSRPANMDQEKEKEDKDDDKSDS
ncbi:piezo-type mechanosensitive ion channel component-like isoform X3 [Panonychus citri]|uniref:piezo-type mechanosensitive ion channel component-like isoform X3 n=1 Tax=Panonychus citri TaxID=50023 RepID=UPI002307BE16|nr:piezo-type mechanosensitive ion channel component-like isoform X3 [Panonychus citri]